MRRCRCEWIGRDVFPPILERGHVDRPVEGSAPAAAKAQAGDEGNRLVMAVRTGGA